ncbi:aspartate aminotransferase family protein [Streptomyces erythrochromogenes]|uniref:class-III pyridoxal-phosphate-dependent aminotransferase n=1 Tax=Streptomyces erythrochromogenes TaxID=285574 RepID=UPI0033DC7C16
MGEHALSIGGGTPAITIVRGEGVRVWDTSGRAYIDCTSQSWALYLGHAHPEIRAHVGEVMGDLWHTHQGFHTLQREAFADRLIGLSKASDTRYHYDRVVPAVSGALALESAIKLAALDRPDRRLIGRVRGSFHGTTLGMAGASWPGTDDVPTERRTLAAFAGFGPAWASLSFPEPDRSPQENLKVLDEELTRFGDLLLAVLVEPVQGSGGQREVPRYWLERLRDRAARQGFMVVYDEIQTYIRCGRYFTDIDQLGPHMVALGKGLAGGFACGAVLMRDDVPGFPRTGTYDLHTFASSALAHSVAVKVIDIVERDGLLLAARDSGARLRAGLQALQHRFPEIHEVRQVGLHIGVEFVEPGTNAYAPEFAASVRHAALERGLLVGLGGYKPEVVKVKPPLIVTREEIDVILERFGAALEATHAR